MRSFLAGAALATSMVVLTTPSQAMEIDYGVSCLRQDELRSYLDRAFNEGKIAQGALENGNRVELFAAGDGSWTMVELPGDGYGCIHSYGHGLQVDQGKKLPRPAS